MSKRVGVICTVMVAIQTFDLAMAQANFGTAITYQGNLSMSGSAVDELADFEFTLWDADAGGGQVGPLLSLPNVDVVAGLFTVELDFGQNIFDGDSRWLEVAVRVPAGVGAYTTLTTRQELTPVPYAIYAAKSGSTFSIEPPLDLFSNDPLFTVRSTNTAVGTGLIGRNTSTGRAGHFVIEAPFNMAPALQALTDGLGQAAWFESTNAASAVPALRVDTLGAGQAGLFNVNNVNSASPVIEASTVGIGRAGYFRSGDNAANASPVIEAGATAAGSAGLFRINNAANDATALEASTDGTGRAGRFDITNAANLDPALEAVTVGVNSGVIGVSGAAPPILGEVGGVQGVSVDKKGVSGKSGNTDGVYGKTEEFNTFSNPLAIVGGVHGQGTVATTPDNFGVVGTAEGYGTGVLGVGSAGGMGVLGVSGFLPGNTVPGVRGVTREKDGGQQGWPPVFALAQAPDKDMVGVLGQAWHKVAVWGESATKIGVVGNTGDFLSFQQLPSQPMGVYGVASQANGIGVHGKSVGADPNSAGVRGVNPAVGSQGAGVIGRTSSTHVDAAGVRGIALDTTSAAKGVFGESKGSPSAAAGVRGLASHASGSGAGVSGESLSANINAAGVSGTISHATGSGAGVVGASSSTLRASAGVRAIGNGNDAAALQIQNGAITVTGAERPAGSVPVVSAPFATGGAPCELAVDTVILNSLIRPDSIVLVTLDGPSVASATTAVYVNAKSSGTATVRVHLVFGDQNGDGVCDIADLGLFLATYSMSANINYLIINPEGS